MLLDKKANTFPKVCHITDNLKPGVGLPKVILAIMRAAENRDSMDTCLYIGNGHFDATFDDYPVENLGYINRIYFKPKKLCQLVLVLKKLRSEGVSILHAHTRKGDTVCQLGKLMGFKTIRTQHITYANLCHSDTLVSGVLRKVRALLTFNTWWMDQWVGVSKAAKSYINSRWCIPGSKIEVIYNSVDTSVYSPASDSQKQALRDKLGWKLNETVLIAVGTLVHGKCYEMMIAAFAKIHEQHDNARLVIVGDGCLRHELPKQIDSLGLNSCADLLGLRNDVPDLMKAADMLIHTGVGEAFGLVICEAMSSGLPVVAPKGQGPAEIVLDGVNGLLFEPLSVSDCTEKLNMLIDDRNLRRCYSKNARIHVQNKFSSEAMEDLYCCLYKDVVARAKR